MSPRTALQVAEQRAKSEANIKQAAMQVFSTDGYHHASVSKIAAAAGVSKGLMYNYFSSKEELLRILINEVIEEAKQHYGLPEKGALDSKKMKDFVKKSFSLVAVNPKKWKVFFSMFMQEEVLAIMEEDLKEKSIMMMKPFVKYFKQQGAKDPVATTRYFHATLDGVKMQLMHDPENFPAKEVRKMIIKQFVK